MKFLIVTDACQFNGTVQFLSQSVRDKHSYFMSEVGNIFVNNKILYKDDAADCARVLKACKAFYTFNKYFRTATNKM
jgi:hypothetical protein